MSTNGHSNGHGAPIDPIPHPSHPWARQPGESAKAYAAFLQYRDLPPKHHDPYEQRSLANLARKLEVSITALQGWSADFGWVRRAAAWDVAVAQERDRAHFAAIGDMSRRQAEQAARTNQALSAVTEALVRRLATDADGTIAELGKMPLAKLVALVADVQHSVVKVASMERLARGADTARVSIQDSDSLGLYDSILSDPETADLAQALVRKMTEAPTPPVS
jgi:hypothetical protein